MRDNLPSSAAIFCLNNASLGIVQPKQLRPWYLTCNGVPLRVMCGVRFLERKGRGGGIGTIETQKYGAIVEELFGSSRDNNVQGLCGS